MNRSWLHMGIGGALVAATAFAGVLLMRYSEADDAPGGVVLGALIVLAGLVVGFRVMRRR